MAIWQNLPRNMDKRSANNFTEGLDTEKSPFFIADNAIVDGYGWDFDEYPAIKVRRGRTTYGASGAATTRLLTNFGNVHLVRAVGTKLQYNSTGTTWTDISGTWTDTDWDATNFDIGGQALIVTNGTDTPQYWNGSALAALADMPEGKYVASDNRRVYTAGVSGTEDVIYYCAFQDATDWTTPENSGAVQFYTDRGGPVTALKAYAGQIWAFKKDAYCLIFHTGDSRITHRLVEGSNDIGCASYKTLLECAEYLFWLGETDVYIGAGGAASPIGAPIKRYIDSINSSAISNAFAFTDDDRYYLCIPTGANTQPDTCLVYDTRFKKWYPYSANLPSLRFGAQLNNTAYCGDSSGQTYKMNDGTTDAGTAIPWLVQSKPFDEGMKESEKELWEMHLQGLFPSGTTLSVEVAPDEIGSTWYSISYDPTGTASATQNKNMIVPLDTIPLCHFYSYRLSGTGPATIQEVQRYSRLQTVQY
jgi:hypothetical protein